MNLQSTAIEAGFSSGNYNALFAVEDVDRELRGAAFFYKPFDELRELLVRNGVSGFVGVVLLHNHSSLRSDEAATLPTKRWCGPHPGLDLSQLPARSTPKDLLGRALAYSAQRQRFLHQ